MRNYSRFLLIGCLLALPVAAQRGGGMRGGGSHSGGGFHGGSGFRSGGGFHGGGGFRGGGYGGGFRSGGFGGGYYRGGFRGGYGGYHNGYGRNRFFFGASFGLGYPYYGYYGGYPYYGYPYSYYDYYGYPSSYYDYGYAPAPSYYDYGHSASSAPAVVTYQADPAPPVRIYEPPVRSRSDVRDDAETAPPQRDGRSIYLIAFKNQDNIRAAEAYWVTGATLHYVTLQHEQKQAPLDLVDRALTYRLNRERHVDFRLPAADW